MILDKLANYKTYCTRDSLLEKGFNFLINNFKQEMEDGKYEIDGENCFALVQSYKTVNSLEKRFESHEKYIDIQYLAVGEEVIEYLPAEKLEKGEDLRPDSDLIFFKEPTNIKIVKLALESGTFGVFHPQDGHKPGITLNSEKEVKKVVIKVKV